MTSTDYNPRADTERFAAKLTEPDDTGPLPDTVYLTNSFIQRLPSQRLIDLLKQFEPDKEFAELMRGQAGRLAAFRAFIRDHPNRDPTSLWAHAYDVEVAIVDVDPTNGSEPTRSPLSAATTG
jgi:hypothetical protein